MNNISSATSVFGREMVNVELQIIVPHELVTLTSGAYVIIHHACVCVCVCVCVCGCGCSRERACVGG